MKKINWKSEIEEIQLIWDWREFLAAMALLAALFIAIALPIPGTIPERPREELWRYRAEQCHLLTHDGWVYEGTVSATGEWDAHKKAYQDAPRFPKNSLSEYRLRVWIYYQNAPPPMRCGE